MTAVTKTVVSPEIISKSRMLLAEAKTLDEVLQVRNVARAAQQYFKAAGHSRRIAQEAAEIRLRAERKAGEILVETKERGERASASKGRPEKESHVVTLSDLDITKMQSSRWQAIASVPEPVFEKYIEKGRASELDELTSSHLFTLAKF